MLKILRLLHVHLFKKTFEKDIVNIKLPNGPIVGEGKSENECHSDKFNNQENASV